MDMKIVDVYYNQPIDSQKPLSACIGFFDGLHKGHQQLVEKALEKKELTPALITFDPDPIVVLRNNPDIKHIMTLEDKIEIAKELGIEVFIILHSDKELLSQNPDDFVRNVLGALNVKHLVCGFDFRYGFRGAGNSSTLQEYPELFSVEVIEEVDYQKEKISTTRIVRYLKEGRVDEAEYLLSRPFTISGTIVSGNQKGREIGFPTANLKAKPEYHEVKDGVYITEIKVKGTWYPAMTNVGHNLTFNTSDPLSIETYILDFNESIYNEEIQLSFRKLLRPEIKFDTVAELIDQMKEDEEQTRQFYK